MHVYRDSGRLTSRGGRVRAVRFLLLSTVYIALGAQLLLRKKTKTKKTDRNTFSDCTFDVTILNQVSSESASF
jgi:hypothetical protein